MHPIEELPDRTSTIPGPPPIPVDQAGDFALQVDESELIVAERPRSEPPPLPIVAVIPRGGARGAIVGAMLDVYRSIYHLENIAGAILRGAERGDELALPVEGAVEVAKQALRNMGALVLQAARELDAGKVTP